ncbi:hypothetical protein LSH36_1053g01075, partial [Paralvinella palmiformis]
MNKVALVTGSTSGIGLSIAETLASRGCSLIITGFGDDEHISKITENIRSKYEVKINYIFADLSNTKDISTLWQQVTELYPEGVDILVNSAGWGRIINLSSVRGLRANPLGSAYCAAKHGLLGLTK